MSVAKIEASSKNDLELDGKIHISVMSRNPWDAEEE